MNHPAFISRVRAWGHQQIESGRTQGLIQALMLVAAAVVLVVPLRPGHPAVIDLHRWLHRHETPVALAPAPQRPVARAVAHAPAIQRHLDFGGQQASADARRVAQWVVDSADNGLLNFAILDKKDARVFVFDPSGRLLGASPVLLGSAPGDDSVAGIGTRPIADVLPSERTTPAGRFRARPGHDAIPEEVLWVDYDTAVAMHRVRLTNPAEHRAERLASPNVKDRRISYGCINMPPAFFEQVLWPHFGERGGYVYVLPEVKSLGQVFPALAKSAGTMS